MTTTSNVTQSSSAAQPIISVKDLLKDAQQIHEFRGDNSYALTSFLRDVDTILPLLQEYPQVQQYVFQRIIINKIQGPALDVVRTLGTGATWSTIKSALIQNFGVKESYHQLYHQAFSARNNQVREYFTNLKKILSKLNEKYEYDENKPSEFSPNVNEATILRTFVNNIEPNLASVILSRKIENLREAFTLLENLGLIRDKNKMNNNVNHNKLNNHNVNHNKNQFSSNVHYNYRQDSGHYRHNNNYRQNNSGHYNQNNRPKNDNFSGRIQRPFDNRYNNNTQRQENKPEPMEIDHVQHEVNFQVLPPKFTYQ